MPTDAFDEAFKLYIEIIECLRQVADVTCVYNSSNHDYLSGYMLTKAVEARYHDNANVVFDSKIIHRKYCEYGQNLIGTSH